MIKLYRGIANPPHPLNKDLKNMMDFPQDFCDSEREARTFAGKNGYLMVVELKDEEAKEYYHGVYRKPHPEIGFSRVDGYQISHRQLRDHEKEWHYNIIGPIE